VLDLLAATTTSDTTGPFNGVSDFFDSSYFTAFEKLMVIFVVAFYLALIFWTAKDARRRIEDPVIVAVCIATAFFFPFVGVLVYLILRPPEYLADVRERELEIKAMERRLGADSVCPYCRNPAEASFLSCPHDGHAERSRVVHTGQTRYDDSTFARHTGHRWSSCARRSSIALISSSRSRASWMYSGGRKNM